MVPFEPGGTRWRTVAFAAWALIGVLLLLVAAGWALNRIAPALAPFLLAFLFVFGLQGPVAHLESMRVPRGWAVAFLFVIVFSVLSFVAVIVAPPIGRELVAFSEAIPEFLSQGQELLEQAQQQVSELILPEWISRATVSVAQALSALLVRLSNTVATWVLTTGSGIATIVFDLFLAVVIAFWTLKDLPKIRKELRVLAGDRYEDDLENLLSTIGRMVGGYLKGQTIASIVTGFAVGVGLALLGVPYALVLGIIAFVLNYVPYVGAFVAGLIAATIALVFNGWVTALIAIVISVASQNVTDTVVTPRVMSEQVDLHPTLVIFSLLVGGTLFGFWGMILAIPFAATAKALFVYYWERKTSRQLATEDGALFRAPTCDPEDEPCEAEADGGIDTHP